MPRKKVDKVDLTQPPGQGTPQAEVQRAVTQELFLDSFMTEMDRIMVEQGINQAELARRLGQTSSNLTQLKYGGNLSSQTMSNIAAALGHRIMVRFKPMR